VFGADFTAAPDPAAAYVSYYDIRVGQQTSAAGGTRREAVEVRMLTCVLAVPAAGAHRGGTR
jgi:hypothetical protein